MRIFKALALAGVMSVGVASATVALAADKKVEKKCDKDGKVCGADDKSDDCKPDHCKK